MKYKLFIGVTMFLSVSAHASEWTHLAVSPSGEKSYGLSTSSSDLFPVIWYKVTDKNNHTLTISKDVIDCRKSKYSIKEISTYNNMGAVTSKKSYTFNSWNEITPGSMGEFEYAFACHRDLTP